MTAEEPALIERLQILLNARTRIRWRRSTPPSNMPLADRE